MNGVEIRAARAAEADDALRVLCAAFGLNYDAARPIYYRDPFFDLSHKRLLLTPTDGILSCLTVIPSLLRVGRAWVPMGGIAGVATRPDRQGQGWGSRLLAVSVPSLADELGYPLSGLFPATEGLYRRAGWETVSEAVRWRGRPADLLAHAEGLLVRPRVEDDAPTVRALQATMAVGLTGGCVRDERRWRVIEAAPGREWVVYQPPGEPVTGYAAYEGVADEGKDTLRLLEMHGATPEARRGLIGFFARQTPRAANLEWPAAEADLAAFGLTGDGMAREPGMMLRLTDVPAALAAVHAANLAPVLARTGQTLTVHAQDALRPANARPVRLAAAGVTPGTDADPDWIAADMRVLAQLYLGYCVPSDAHGQGRLRASSPSALALADELFPTRAPFVAPLDQF
ncbi:MAG: GNAT family N-acetyltransferase [Armatimonadetes bacterium]|nr:GNAT family N-acetyltransferase [Armatimonadota bacterium]